MQCDITARMRNSDTSHFVSHLHFNLRNIPISTADFLDSSQQSRPERKLIH
jgi:hypothetical protein